VGACSEEKSQAVSISTASFFQYKRRTEANEKILHAAKSTLLSCFSKKAPHENFLLLLRLLCKVTKHPK